MTCKRREFVKQMAIAWAMSVAESWGLAGKLAADTFNEDILADPLISWKKAPCRFCGTGCGVLVGVKDGKVVAVAGDRENPVNKGLLCVKGYHLPGILYGSDRLTTPLIKKNGVFHKASWKEALTLIADQFKTVIAKKGADAVALYGSGQWTVQDGYAGIKFMKGGLGTNNIEANARLCMASAVVGFLKTFGKDEPMGCYDDFENGDVFVMWGNNMAEMHPVLFSRITERKRTASWVKIVDIGTRRTRTTAKSDLYLEFKPHTDIAIANAIAHEIIHRGRVHKKFISRHVLFKKSTPSIGYGLEGEAKKKISTQEVSFDEYSDFLKPYTPEYVEEVSGVPASKIRELATWYANPDTRVVSLWCMGVNQHTRGTWMNNLEESRNCIRLFQRAMLKYILKMQEK